MTETRHATLGLHPLEADPHELLQRRQIVRRAKLLVLALLLLLGLGAGRTVFMRLANARALEAGAAENARQFVKTATPRRGGAGQTLSLPGTLQGQQQSPIAARTSGYLLRWTRDIGAPVKKGELLAEIDTPEVDQQLRQAVAARDQAAASLELARSTLARWEALRTKDVASQQELDERRSAVSQSSANLAAAEANVQRLRQTEAFKRVVAPFAGVITRRNVEVGDLVDAGGGATRPLFVLTQTDPLRVSVSVPQAYAHLVRPGQKVTVTQGELRGQKFAGEVARTAGSIDTTTRTMQVDIALPNADGKLLPGAYVQVALPLPASQALLAPANALIVRAEGTQVAVVDAQGKVTLRKVQVGRNLGTEFEVLSGLDGREPLVLNPPDSLADGQTVVVVAPERAASAAAAAASTAASAAKTTP